MGGAAPPSAPAIGTVTRRCALVFEVMAPLVAGGGRVHTVRQPVRPLPLAVAMSTATAAPIAVTGWPPHYKGGAEGRGRHTPRHRRPHDVPPRIPRPRRRRRRRCRSRHRHRRRRHGCRCGGGPRAAAGVSRHASTPAARRRRHRHRRERCSVCQGGGPSPELRCTRARQPPRVAAVRRVGRRGGGGGGGAPATTARRGAAAAPSAAAMSDPPPQLSLPWRVHAAGDAAAATAAAASVCVSPRPSATAVAVTAAAGIARSRHSVAGCRDRQRERWGRTPPGAHGKDPTGTAVAIGAPHGLRGEAGGDDGITIATVTGGVMAGQWG